MAGKLNFEELNSLYSAQEQQSENAGFNCKRQNLKLLKKANGNLRVVRCFQLRNYNDDSSEWEEYPFSMLIIERIRIRNN